VSVLLGTVLAAAVQGSLTVSDKTENRFHDEPTSATTSRTVVDADTTLLALMRLWSRRAEVNLSYTPRYTLRDYNYKPTAEILQRMGLSVGGNTRYTRFVVGEDFAYGRTSFTTLSLGQTTTSTPAPGAPPIERLPLVETIHYVSSRSYFLGSISSGRFVRYGAYADYNYSGGTDTESKGELPLQKSGRGELSLEVIVGRRDTLVSMLRGSRVVFEAGTRVPAIDVLNAEQLQGVRHRFLRTTEGMFSVGAMEVGQSVEHEPRHWKAYPIAELMLRHLAPDHIEARFYARFAPFIDRLTGNVDYQVQASLTGLWTVDTPRRGWVVRSLVGVGESLPPTKARAISVILVEGALGYRTSRYVLLEVGARVISQRFAGTDPPPLLWLGFFSATFTTEAMRF
jgi:hypothetical protein